MFSFKNLLIAYYNCRKHKRFSRSATIFEFGFEKELLRLEYELKTGTYKPSKYTCFAVTDPKLREVWAADFRDRIIHHLLINFIEPIFEPKFIFHSYACRKNKGAHFAIKNLQKAIAKRRPQFYLQIDVQSFFTSIDKNILFSILKKHLKNQNLLWLAKTIIFHSPQENFHFKGDINLIKSVPKHKSLLYSSQDKGLPIGNLSSQFFANLYLNELDQFSKHKLKCRDYYRYMDDMLILGSDKKQLIDWKNKIEAFLAEKSRLRLHPKKSKLKKISEGIDFLGYIVKPNYVLARKRTVKKLKNKLWRFNREIIEKISNENMNTKKKKSESKIYNRIFNHPYHIFSDPKIVKNFKKIYSSINSSYSCFKHGNCYGLRKNLYEKHFGILRIYLRPVNKHYEYFIWDEGIKNKKRNC